MSSNGLAKRCVGGSIAVLAIAAAMISAPAAAQHAREGAYVGLRLTGGQSSVEDVTTTGFAGNRIDNNTEDPTAAAGGVFGYRFGDLPLRVEGELSHRFRMDYDVRDPGGPGHGYENNLSSTMALVSGAWEIRTDSAWTPFIGATVGWVRNSSEIERSNLTTGAITKTENTTNSLALGAMVGVDYELARNWGTELAYRYLDMGEVESGTQAGGETINAETYVSHDLMLSLLYRF
ncbi:outer membrane beta-barrel protein [Marivibrio halodurans]|uniref:Outer membrane beta-barrel protein n=1 Tax=Marivibrio halodurans TaxID=2039722 RepID=A0A8J7V3R0_9PROT|nr:outer membrane beta-barrel protein [Marivibrio halodurans]